MRFGPCISSLINGVKEKALATENITSSKTMANTSDSIRILKFV